MDLDIRARLFVSYAREDRYYFDALLPTLQKSSRDCGIGFQSDQDIPLGGDWDDWIAAAIGDADIVLCLTSTDYLASEYIRTRELPLIMSRLKDGVLLIPLFARYCRLERNSPFLTKQGLNTPEKPISDMSIGERDRLFASLEKDLCTMADEIQRRRTWNRGGPYASTAEAHTDWSADTHAKVARARYNIVVVGRTGAGKSSLINYLFGADVREVRAGLPVTERGFHRQDMEIEGVPSTIFDSWGLETATADQWLRDLNEELARRSVATPVDQWFHTIVYCLQASSHRVEPFETEVLRRFRDQKYRVIVALTKADAVSDEEITTLERAIHSTANDDLPVIPICTVEKKTRTGLTLRFGLRELLSLIRLGLWESITDRVPSRCVSLIHSHIDEEKDNMIRFVREQTGFFNHAKIAAELRSMIADSSTELTKEGGLIGRIVLRELQITVLLYQRFESLINSEGISSVEIPIEVPLITTWNPVISLGIAMTAQTLLASLVGSSLVSGGVALAAAPIVIGARVLYSKWDFTKGRIDDIEKFWDGVRQQTAELEPALRRAIVDQPAAAG